MSTQAHPRCFHVRAVQHGVRKQSQGKGTNLASVVRPPNRPYQKTPRLDADSGFGMCGLQKRSIISVRDRGHWIADLDILAINFEKLNRISTAPDLKPCPHTQGTGEAGKSDFISLDTWEELLDRPEEGRRWYLPSSPKLGGTPRFAAVSNLNQQGLSGVQWRMIESMMIYVWGPWGIRPHG